MELSGVTAENVLNIDTEEINRLIKPIFTEAIWANMTESDKFYQRVRFIVYVKHEMIRSKWSLQKYLLEIIPLVVMTSDIKNFDDDVVISISPYETPYGGHAGFENSQLGEENNHEATNPVYSNQAEFTIFIYLDFTDNDTTSGA
ncbi:uncharacterized protein LOC143197351 [Rhynchophorus ferrugineus]|uniref:uncharacterized protein LOC143197351 n=1 Tax=Rhynchophorus ferrugineus TaxID=354439 RepID=UPI003FCD6175